jgi:cobalt/nickel transport system ATP-binding protein
LILDPEVLLLDEPTAGLDPSSQSQIIELLGSSATGSKTVIMATHDLDALEEIADRCYLLENGRIAGEGTPMEILHDVELLERTGLIRPHRHSHGGKPAGPHPHLHTE